MKNNSEITGTGELPLLNAGDGLIPLFMPNIPKRASEYIDRVLSSRWIGQGPLVTEFENRFARKFLNDEKCMAVGSGTDAIHLAYLLAGVEAGDEVLTPLFTCTATNIPLLYIGAKPVFVDVDPKTLNIDVDDLEKKITAKSKAIMVVHYGGLSCQMDKIGEIARKHGLKVIEDAAHALGGKYLGRNVGTISDFTMFSFQAIKHITTGDGGMLVFKDKNLIELAQRLRWFGIDRNAKQQGIWENDIKEVGYKYQLTDLGAAVGLAGLDDFEETLELRKVLLKRYVELFKHISQIEIVGYQIESEEIFFEDHAAWLFTILTDKRRELQRYLYSQGVEANQVHFRNDRYSIFKEFSETYPSMDYIEDKYLVLPLHTKMSLRDVERIYKLCSDFFHKELNSIS